jgi:hypothetical protein
LVGCPVHGPDAEQLAGVQNGLGVDIKLADSLSLAVSLPTMIVGFTRCSRDRSFAVLGKHPWFLLAMALGSIVGTFIGWAASGVHSSRPAPANTNLAAIKLWRHR